MFDLDESKLVQDTLSRFAKEEGYRAYRVEGHGAFGYLITPDDNVLVVNKGTFGGITFTLSYVPSYQNGSGCQCLDDALWEVPTLEQLKKVEKEGLIFAKKLGAKRYHSSAAWLQKNYWAGKGCLREVTGEV